MTEASNTYEQRLYIESELTVLVFAEMVVGRFAGFTRACFIMSTNSELVNHFLFQAFDLHFRSGVSGFRYLDPIHRKFVFHLNGVVSDWPATVALRLLPFQGYANVVIIEDFWFTRFAGLI